MSKKIYRARVEIDFVGFDPLLSDEEDLINGIIDAVEKMKRNISITTRLLMKSSADLERLESEVK